MKLYANCDFFAFSLTTKLITEKLYLFAFAFFFHYIYYGIFSFSNNLFNHLFTSHRDYKQELLEKLFNEKFLRFACLFYYKIEFMKKGTCYKHMRHTNMYTKNIYLKYSSPKLRFEKEKLCYGFDTRNNIYRFIDSNNSQIDIIYFKLLNFSTFRN